ncbi:tail fiber assembly protein [Escherichia coli]|uniref:tail fiber assembly protein n=1 Tax=Escherichia coli TaxID=562 RepID=UPI0023416ACE|nr:tail fiber assembly protein [Escherichia coli]MDC3459718.1 tail fiber assembly protein [Escherichia coli]
MNDAVLNSEFIATKAGNITVYNYDGETREYISTSAEYLAVGVGIPAHSCLDAPGTHKAGYAICRSADLNSWEYVPDHRGETVYNTVDGQLVEIKTLGDYPENVTTLVPATPYDKWDGEKWITDVNARHDAFVADGIAKKQQLINLANEYINSKQWPGKAAIGRLKGEELAQYNLWLDYLDALEVTDISSAPDIEWPTPPAVQAR